MKQLHTAMTLLAFSSLLAGCATVTSEGYRQRMDLSVGWTTDQLTADHGQPDNIAPLSDGRELWIYRRARAAYSGGGTTSFTTSYTTDQWTRVSDGKNKSSSSSTTVSLPLQTVPYTAKCETRFVIGVDKHVQAVTFDGDDCVAREQEPQKGAAQ